MFKPVFLKQFRQFHFKLLRPLDIFMRVLKYAKEDVDKMCIEVQKLLIKQVENLHAVSHFNKPHLLFWTTPKTLEPQLRNRLKELRVRSGLHSWKVELARVKYFHFFVSTLNYVSPIGVNSNWIHQLNSKNNGPVLLFNTIFWHW